LKKGKKKIIHFPKSGGGRDRGKWKKVPMIVREYRKGD